MPCVKEGKIVRSQGPFNGLCPLVDPPGGFPLSQPDSRREGRWTRTHRNQALYALKLSGHSLEESQIQKEGAYVGDCCSGRMMAVTIRGQPPRPRALSNGSSDAWETRSRGYKHLWLTKWPPKRQQSFEVIKTQTHRGVLLPRTAAPQPTLASHTPPPTFTLTPTSQCSPVDYPDLTLTNLPGSTAMAIMATISASMDAIGRP